MTVWLAGMDITADRLNDGVGAWADYTPVWASTGTAVALGNGTITGRYSRTGNTVHFSINMITGSSSTYGTGTYSWTLPYTSGAEEQFACHGRFGHDSAIYSVDGQIAVSDTACRFFGSDGTAAIGTTIPVTWDNADSFRIFGTYEATP